MVFIIYGLSNFMIAKYLLTWLRTMLKNIPSAPFYVIYSIAAISIFAAYAIPTKLFIQKYIAVFSYYWISFFFYSFIMISLALIIIAIGFLLRIIPKKTLPSVVKVTGFVILIAFSFIIIFGRINAFNIKHKTYNVEITKETELKELNIVLISDLHLGHINGIKHIKKAVKKINELNPDIVLIAGDIFDGDFEALHDDKAAIEEFNRIKAKYGVYACLGNHDAGNTYRQMIYFLEKSSINVLFDEVKLIDSAFVIAGRRDSRPIGDIDNERIKELIIEKDYTKYPVIVLDHQPSNINEYKTEIDLIVAGHTHKGQIFPANLITKKIYDVDYGYYQKSENTPQVIVTSGVGTWGPPLRIGTDNEIVQIKISFK